MTWNCRIWISCGCLGFALLSAGCGRDIKQVADRHVDVDMLNKHEKRPAVPFFEKHGQFFDIDKTTNVDQEVVLPLLKRLNELAPTPQWVVMRPEKRDAAYGVVIGLPKDPKLVDRMAEAVQEADDKFDGLILQQWGYEWLLINLIDKQTYETLKKSNPTIDQQR